MDLQNDVLITLDDRAGIVWTEGTHNGGAQVIDFQIWSDQATGDFVELATGLTDRSYTAIDLYSGSTYTFKVKARNSVGYSEFSDPVSILAAQIPDTPNAPTTTISNRWTVVVDWNAPYNGGADITSYTIEIRTTDASVYFVDSADCDGSDAATVSATQCSIQVSTLKAYPFNLAWGSSIYARISATNILGTSEFSTDGNGAIILTFPDEPLNLIINPEITWGTVIGLSWDEGLSNGGTPVIDYTLESKSSVDNVWSDL